MAKSKTTTATGTTKAALAGAAGAAAATKVATAAAAAGSPARTQASDLGDRLAPVVAGASERLAPVVAVAGDRLAPVVEDARERLVDLTGTVATRIDDLTGTVSERIDDLTGTVATRLDDALPDRYTPTVVTARSQRRPNRFLQAVFVLGLGTVAALVTRRLTGGGDAGSAWRSADDQPSTPTNGQAGGQAAAAAVGESAHGLLAGDDHASGNVPGSPANTAGETGPAETSVDVAGGTPEEVAADATDTPHEVTTPDDPARKVVLD